MENDTPHGPPEEWPTPSLGLHPFTNFPNVLPLHPLKHVPHTKPSEVWIQEATAPDVL